LFAIKLQDLALFIWSSFRPDIEPLPQHSLLSPPPATNPSSTLIVTTVESPAPTCLWRPFLEHDIDDDAAVADFIVKNTTRLLFFHDKSAILCEHTVMEVEGEDDLK
jgi:hypothetical protein